MIMSLQERAVITQILSIQMSALLSSQGILLNTTNLIESKTNLKVKISSKDFSKGGVRWANEIFLPTTIHANFYCVVCNFSMSQAFGSIVRPLARGCAVCPSWLFPPSPPVPQQRLSLLSLQKPLLSHFG